MTDNEWYQKCWDSIPEPKRCAECGQYLQYFSRMFISHIVSKGSFPALRHHLKNFMPYCTAHHQQWEFGNRKEMKTYDQAIEIKEMMISQHYTKFVP